MFVLWKELIVSVSGLFSRSGDDLVVLCKVHIGDSIDVHKHFS